MKRLILIAVLACAAPVQAQSPAAPANPMSTALQRSFTSVADFIQRSAEQMPAEKYGYKPTPDVRSFAHEIGHVADAHYLFCSRARNEANPQSARIEGNVLGKAELVAKYRESVTYCKGAYESMTDAQLSQPFEQGQARGVRLAPLANNAAHDNEHYGKIVTIMRLNGMVPPSSQPRQ